MDTPKYNSEMIISKSKGCGVYGKHMASEILLMLSYNKTLIPHLVISNMLSFMFDMRQSIFSETSREHELAVEAEINIAQTVAKIFIHTNPVLIQDAHKADAIKLMAKCLLGGDTHHELLIFEGLLALTNISSCINTHQTDLGLGKSLAMLPCGAKKGQEDNTRPLYNILTREFIFEPNSKI